MSNLNLIEMKGISKTYDIGNIKVRALKNISLKIEKGEFISIMGPSGSGKSTLLHIIGCLDKYYEGYYYLEKIKVKTLKEDELAQIRLKKIGFVFQSYNLIPQLSVFENIELPLLYNRVKMRRERVLDILEKVGLAEKSKHLPTQLSMGEQQRVAIARALVNNPLIILADEPTGNLDSKTSKEIISIFQEFNKEGATILLVTHNLEIARYAQRLITLQDGEIIDDKLLEY